MLPSFYNSALYTPVSQVKKNLATSLLGIIIIYYVSKRTEWAGLENGQSCWSHCVTRVVVLRLEWAQLFGSIPVSCFRSLNRLKLMDSVQRYRKKQMDRIIIKWARMIVFWPRARLAVLYLSSVRIISSFHFTISCSVWKLCQFLSCKIVSIPIMYC
jgi:hypothetical protein